MSARVVIALLSQFAVAMQVTSSDAGQTAIVNYQRWNKGVSSDPSFFPIAVWLQAPKNAERFRKAGINLYVGLWRGPTEEQLRALKAADMPTICAQNQVGLNSENADVIVGWMHGDEPDNAQPRRNEGGYGPPILPSTIVAEYLRMRQQDPSRPVLLNLGQGVAFDQYIGRGIRRNHPEDYPEYIKGCDIDSFDIYPAVHRNEAVAGKLEFVAKGVERLRRWSHDDKTLYLFAVNMRNRAAKATLELLRPEASAKVQVLGESRFLEIRGSRFEDEFEAYAVHLYRLLESN